MPVVVDTAKLAALGWTPTPLEETFARTVAEHLGSGRTGAGSDTHEFGVDRETEAALIEQLAE